MAELREFDDRDAMAEAAAQAAADRLRGAIAAHGAASLSVCGGATPGPVYRALSRADLDWTKVVVTLSDERWVAADAPESNERLVRETLLRDRAAAARFIGLHRDGAPGDALEAIEQALGAAPRPIDAGLLGIGEDGHTASLFPGTEDGPLAADAPSRVAAIARDGPGPVTEGVTMTLPELAAHRALIFLATGQTKRAIIDAVLGIAGDPEDLPVARVVAAARGDVDLYWAP